METLRSTSGFTSEASLSGNHRPQTPPYTPYRNKAKRRLERADSPASVNSIQPAETSSPARKAAKRALTDNVKVEELAEGEVGYQTDLDIVYPGELEEVGSSDGDGDNELSNSDDDHSDDGAGSISRRLSRLRCGDENAEAKFEQGRRQRRLSKRMGSRVFKRSHSQSVKSETEVTDVDAMADQDVAASQRRLRRRTRGPGDTEIVFEDIPTSSAEAAILHGSVPPRSRPGTPTQESRMSNAVEDDAMEVDDGG